MPNKVDAVLLATATTLMWRCVDRGAGVLGIRSFSSLLGAGPPWHERTDSRRSQHSCQRSRLANMKPRITADHKEDFMFADSFKLTGARHRAPRFLRVALAGVALALAVPGHAQDAEAAHAA